MRLDDFDYVLPTELIAQRPLEERSDSRLLFVSRRDRSWEDGKFRDLPDLLRGDELVVVNNTRVLRARLFGRRRGIRAEPPGRQSRLRREHLSSEIEVLLTRELEPLVWEGLVRPGRKMQVGERVVFGEGELEAEVMRRGDYGLRRLRFTCSGDFSQTVEKLGHVPLPPYIDRPDEAADGERYQTIFANRPGAVAAPTAALHFDAEVLARLKQKGIEFCEITLHVGLGTFQPIRIEHVEHHHMLPEPYEITEGTVERIREAKREGRPVLAVGTTVVRALEDAARRGGEICPGRAEAQIFIYPGYRFRAVDRLLTNFHLPKSSLLLLVAAFAGRGLVLDAYRHAVDQGYRFYSYGDCMLIV